MNAKEARNIANGSTTPSLKNVLSKIKQAAQDGDYQLPYTCSMVTDDIEADLVKLGFRIEPKGGYNIISW